MQMYKCTHYLVRNVYIIASIYKFIYIYIYMPKKSPWPCTLGMLWQLLEAPSLQSRLLPIASLFQLTLASSYMHHMELTRCCGLREPVVSSPEKRCWLASKHVSYQGMMKITYYLCILYAIASVTVWTLVPSLGIYCLISVFRVFQGYSWC